MQSKALVTTANVSAANAIKTPQFWLLWVVLLCNVTAGIGILEQASPMIQDFFRGAGGKSTVAVAAAAGFVGLLSIFNMAGRFGWSTTSDMIGRKPIYAMYLGVGIVALLRCWPTIGHNSTAIFVLLAAVIISFYGGGFATVPAYLRDLFGGYQVGAIHGRLLTAWSVAGVAGPLIVNGFLDREGQTGHADRVGVPAGVVHDGRRAGGRLHRQPADPPGRRAVPREDHRSRSRRSSEMNQTPRLVISWLLVAVLLGYGIIETLITAVKIFTVVRRCVTSPAANACGPSAVSTISRPSSSRSEATPSRKVPSGSSTRTDRPKVADSSR